jgi:uncharacterized membrane protein
MRIAIDIVVVIVGLFLLYRLLGKSAVQSAVLFAGILLMKDVIANLFGTTGVMIYMGLIIMLFIGIYLSKKASSQRK